MEQLELDGVAQRYYDAIDNDTARARVDQFIEQLPNLTDEELKVRIGCDVLSCAILPSADLDCVLSLAHSEAERRAVAAGRNPRCERHNLYHRGWLGAYESQGHRRELSDCICGTE